MFSNEDLKCLDPAYFSIITTDAYDVTIMSRNTGHYWYLRINVNWCRTETEFISVFILHFSKKVQGMQDVYINTRTGKILKNFL